MFSKTIHIYEHFFIFYDSTRLNDDDEGAAKTGVTQTTRKVAVYPHPINRKITFCDLPGIGTVPVAWYNTGILTL
jgi:hypothetical protein